MRTFLYLIFFLVFLIFPFAGSQHEILLTANYSPASPQMFLEIKFQCKGYCVPTPRETTFYLLDNGKAVYQEEGLQGLEYQKEKRLTQQQTELFIKLAESDDFLQAPKDYDSKIRFRENTFITTIRFKKGEKFKEINHCTPRKL